MKINNKNNFSSSLSPGFHKQQKINNSYSTNSAHLIHHFGVVASRLLDLIVVLRQHVMQGGKMVAHLHDHQPDVQELLLVRIQHRSAIVVLKNVPNKCIRTW